MACATCTSSATIKIKLPLQCQIAGTASEDSKAFDAICAQWSWYLLVEFFMTCVVCISNAIIYLHENKIDAEILQCHGQHCLCGLQGLQCLPLSLKSASRKKSR